jgi:hypothetical protein
MASIAVLRRLRIARLTAFSAGVIVLGWIVTQMAMIGYVSWMQPTTAIAGVAILTFAWLLPGPTAPLQR